MGMLEDLIEIAGKWDTSAVEKYLVEGAILVTEEQYDKLMDAVQVSKNHESPRVFFGYPVIKVPADGRPIRLSSNRIALCVNDDIYVMDLIKANSIASFTAYLMGLS